MSKASDEIRRRLDVAKASAYPPMESYFTNMIPALCDEIEAGEKRIAELTSELIQSLADVVTQCGYYVPQSEKYGGWYDTQALKYVMEAGDRLVELGVWEKHPEGTGRRWFYRPLRAAGRLEEKDKP